MAQRKFARALANFGQSLQQQAAEDYQDKKLRERQAIQDQQIALRQKEQDDRISERQRAAQEAENLRNLQQSLRKGEVLPQQLTEADRTSLGGNVLQFSPPETNIIQPLMAQLQKANTPGEVASPEELIRQRISTGQPIRDLTGINQLIAQSGQTSDRLVGADVAKRAADVEQAGAQAQAQAKGQATGAFEAKTAQEPQALEMLRRELQVKSRAAGDEAYARSNGEIKSKVENAANILKLEKDKAEMLAKVAGNKEFDAKRVAARAAVTDTANKALGEVGQLYTSYIEAKDSMKKLANRITPAALDTYVHTTYAGLPKEVRLYFQKLEGDLPFLARLQGEVGNLAEQEQQRQLFSMPTAYDAVDGTGEYKLETKLAMAMKAGEIHDLNNDPEILKLPIGERFKMLEAIIEQGRQELAASRPQPKGRRIDTTAQDAEIEQLFGGR